MEGPVALDYRMPADGFVTLVVEDGEFDHRNRRRGSQAAG
jgi:hypothetical protein